MAGVNYRHWVYAACSVPILISISSIAGWISGKLYLASLYPGWKSMAPVTAFSTMMLSLILLIDSKKRIGNIFSSILLLILLFLFGIILLDRLNLGLGGFEFWFIPVKDYHSISKVNIGVMSSLTFTVLSLVVIILAAGKIAVNKITQFCIGSMGTVVCCFGIIDITGYIIQNQILKGMISLPTGISFIFLGFAVILNASPQSFPARLFLSERTSSIILRRVIPLVLAAVLLQGLLTSIHGYSGLDSVYAIALYVVALVLILIFVSAKVSAGLGVIIDKLIYERETAKTCFAEIENKYERLVESLQEGIAVLNGEGRVQYANPRLLELLDISGDRFIGQAFLDYIELLQEENWQNFSDCLSSGKIIKKECLIRNVSGRRIFAYITIVPFRNRNESGGAIAGVVDITDKKITEEMLKESVENSEVLLRELYHRTKNNMQVICALIRLRRKDIPDKKSREIFNELDNRILAMSLVHQKLCESKNLSIIDIEDYTRDLSTRVISNMTYSRKRIKVSIDADHLLLPIETANPYGLLLTELIMNSCKHAFSKVSEGLISIKIKTAENEKISLIYSDNGKGLPLDFNVMKNESFGFRMILSLVENQMDGSFRVIEGKGFSAEIIFPSEIPSAITLKL